jgi:hypothetical protein
LVKKTFDGFKIKARAEQNPEKAESYGATKQEGRRRQRQKTTYHNRVAAAPVYKEHHGRDPLLVVSLDFVSDYASGPETDGEESFEDWKKRMGAELGMSEELMGAQAWEHTRFLEHIKPRWRSEQVSI